MSATDKARKLVLFHVEKKHSRSCRAVRQEHWTSPWSSVDTDKPDAFGTRGGRDSKRMIGPVLWTRIRCNDPDCPAILRVNLDAVLVALNAPGTKKPKGGPF